MTQSCDMDCLNCKFPDCIRPEERCTAKYPSWDWDYRRAKQSENLRDAQKRFRAKRKEQGLCIMCGNPVNPYRKITHCDACAYKLSQDAKKRRMQDHIKNGTLTRQEKIERGICSRIGCDCSTVKGKSLCAEHLEAQKEICRKAGKASREKARERKKQN